MKGLSKVIKIKERELQEERERLNVLLAKEKELNLEIEEIKRKILRLKSMKPESILQFALIQEETKRLLKEKEKLKESLEELTLEIDRKREDVGKLRGEVKLIKELMKRKELKEKRVNEVLNERFIYQTLYSVDRN